MAVVIRPQGRFTFWHVWTIFAVGFLLCRGPLFEQVFFNVDEAEYAVGAQGLSNGLLPGLDLVGSTKPPGIVFLYTAVFFAVGESIVALQWIGFMLWLVLLFLTMKIAQRIIPEVPEWMTAISFFLLANTIGVPRDFHALNVELPGIVLSIAGLLAILNAKNSFHLFCAGLLLGLSILFRQSFALFAIGALILMPSRSFIRVTWFSFGIVLPWILILILYSSSNGIGWAYDSWIRYPLLYASDTGFMGFIEAGLFETSSVIRQAFVPFSFVAVGLFLIVKTKHRSLLLLFVLSAMAVAAGSRFFTHYYIQALPVLAILSAVGIAYLFTLSRIFNRSGQVWLGIGVLFAFLHYPFWRYWDDSAPPKGISAESLDGRALEIELAEFASEHTSPDQKIFVWGYCPQIYFHARRLPGVRDFIVHYVTGISPGSTNPRPFARPDAEQMLLDDLARTRPQLIFDLSPVDNYQYSFSNYPLTRYPEIANYIHAHYRPTAQVGPVPIYALASD